MTFNLRIRLTKVLRCLDGLSITLPSQHHDRGSIPTRGTMSLNGTRSDLGGRRVWWGEGDPVLLTSFFKESRFSANTISLAICLPFKELQYRFCASRRFRDLFNRLVVCRPFSDFQ